MSYDGKPDTLRGVRPVWRGALGNLMLEKQERRPVAYPTFKEGGRIQARAAQVLEKAAALLEEIERLGLFATLEKTSSARRTAAKGLPGYVRNKRVILTHLYP